MKASSEKLGVLDKALYGYTGPSIDLDDVEDGLAGMGRGAGFGMMTIRAMLDWLVFLRRDVKALKDDRGGFVELASKYQVERNALRDDLALMRPVVEAAPALADMAMLYTMDVELPKPFKDALNVMYHATTAYEKAIADRDAKEVPDD